MVVWRQARKAEREFRSRNTIWKGVSQLRNQFLAHECHLQHSSSHFEAAIWLQNHLWVAKSLLSCEMGCENSPPLRKCSKLQKWSVNMPLFCEMISKLWNGCEMISKLWNGCKITSKLRNGLQIEKLTCEMEEGLQKHFSKPREVVKMPTEPHNHASEEESPAHPGITHTKPLTPFLTS